MKDNFEVRVYYDSTDAGGVVYHSRYMDFCERARTEFLRNRGIIQSKLIEEMGVGFVVSRAELEFKKSAKLDDLLSVTTELVENNGVILKLKQEIYLVSRYGHSVNNEFLFSMNVCIVCVNRNGKVTRIPKDIISLLI